MNYKILTRRSTYLNRTIIYEVNGEIKQISAPRGIYSFEQLEEQIQKQIGETQPSKEAPPPDGEAEQKKSTSKKSKKTTSPEKEKDSEQ